MMWRARLLAGFADVAIFAVLVRVPLSVYSKISPMEALAQVVILACMLARAHACLCFKICLQEFICWLSHARDKPDAGEVQQQFLKCLGSPQGQVACLLQ